jgi:hypothetical protein
MIVEMIQAELKRLQLNPVNLNVSGKEGGMVTLNGSLLHYWKLPPRLDGQWFLAQLQRLSDAAGTETVMGELVAAYDIESEATNGRKNSTQLRLFDPPSQAPTTKPAQANKDR